MTSKMAKLVYLCILAGLVWPAAAPAGGSRTAKSDAWAKSRLGRTRLGEVWMGPAVTSDDLRGKVVLLDFWGYRCPPCIAGMPHLNKLHNEGSSKGLVVLGAHAQGPAKAQALAIARAQRVKYTILSGATVPGASFGGLPHVFVFDHRGEVVYEGYPGRKMDQALAEAMKRRPAPVSGETQYTVMRSAALKAARGRLGEAWKECTAKKDAAGAAGREARSLLASLDAQAKRLLSKAEQEMDRSPSECVSALETLKRKFADTPHAERADARLKELAGDEQFQMELKAERQYVVIARAADRIPPCPKDHNARSQWTRRHGPTVRRVRGQAARLQVDFPGTRSADKAGRLAKGLMGGH